MFKVLVRTKEHLMSIIDNFDLMSIYSPLFINYLGILYESNFEEKTIEMNFFTTPILMTYRNYFFRLKRVKPKILYGYQVDTSYKLAYAIDSLLKMGIPPPILSPDSIFISKMENPQILLPFFSKRYFCYTHYFYKLLKDEDEIIPAMQYVPFFYEDLDDEDYLVLE